MTTKDFIDIGEGCTRDPRLVTDWDGSTFYYEFTPTMGHMTPEEYEQKATECTLLGGGWSAAEPDELLRGMDWNRAFPAVIPAWAADTKTHYSYLTKCNHPALPSLVRGIFFGDGRVDSFHRSDSGYARFVRRLYVVQIGKINQRSKMFDNSASSAVRFTKLADGCVRDSILYTDADGKHFFREWTPTLNLKGRFDHDDAIKLAASCTLAGGGWSLPADPQELITLVDYDKCEPAIDTEAFPETKPNFYWTAKPVASDPGFAWGVNFDGGYVDGSLRDGNGYVRAVRRVPANQADGEAK